MINNQFTHNIVSLRLARIFTLLVIGINVVVLIGWLSGWMSLTRIAPDEISIAQTTALNFLVLSMGLWGCMFVKKQRKGSYLIVIISATAVICMSGYLLLCRLFEINSEWEHFIFSIPDSSFQYSIGHMSLVTALLFLIFAFAQLFLLSKSDLLLKISSVLSFLILSCSLMILLGYGLKAPFFYSGKMIPPASLTALSFLLASLGLIFESDKNCFIISKMRSTETSAKLSMTFLPIIIAFTLAESIFIVQILPLLPIHPAIAVSLITLFFIAVISFIIPKVARRFGKSLDTATENLRFSEEKFRSHFEYSPVGQSLTGMEETFDVNKSFCNMLGYTEDELKSMNLMTITHPDDIKLTTDRMNELTDGKVKMVRFEKRFFHKNGNIIWVDLSAFLQRDKNRKLQYFISTVSDITANKKMETALKESEANLKELNSTKDKFFSIIAHDLKSPFNAIVGFSNLITDQIRENDYNGIEQYAEIIQNSSQRALDLLKNLFEWSNLQTGRMEYNPEFTDMAAIIRETVALLSPSSELKSIGISMDLPHDHIIFADKAMIGTILRNLISNAIKFTNPGDQIVISAEQLQHELKVSVWDNGVGIGKEELKKLFRIDESHSTPGTLNETGTGLGLILCREFVEKHGGIIWVESEPGKGSTFCFTIPKVLY